MNCNTMSPATPDVSPALIDLAQKMGVPMVVTNDVHFLRADDYEAHNALCCISTGKKVTDPTRMTYPPDVYLKSSEQMRALFAHVEEACDNTLWIAERCNVEIDLKSRHAPKYSPADGSTPGDADAACERGGQEAVRQDHRRDSPAMERSWR